VKKCKTGVCASKGVREPAKGVLFSARTESNVTESSNFESNWIKAPSPRKRGRKPSLSAQKMHELFSAYYSDYYTLRELAAMFKVSRSCVHRCLSNISREQAVLAAPQLLGIML